MEPTPIVDAFHNVAETEISRCVDHPFLHQMLEGALPLLDFQEYVVQDAHYLRSFVVCLNILATRGVECGNESLADILLSLAKSIEIAEVDLHTEYLEKWDISIDTVDPSMTTLLYTSYVKATCACESMSEGLVSLLPCFSVYDIVGRSMLMKRREMRALCDSGVSPYDKWIDLYGSSEFEKEVAIFKAVVEVECRKEGKGAEIYQRHFSLGCKFEYMFWSQTSSFKSMSEGELLFDNKSVL